MKKKTGVQFLIRRELLFKNRVLLTICAIAVLLWILQPRYSRYGWRSNLSTPTYGTVQTAILAFSGLLLLASYFLNRNFLTTIPLLFLTLGEAAIILGAFSLLRFPASSGALAGSGLCIAVAAWELWGRASSPKKKDKNHDSIAVAFFIVGLLATFFLSGVGEVYSFLLATTIGLAALFTLILPCFDETLDYLERNKALTGL